MSQARRERLGRAILLSCGIAIVACTPPPKPPAPKPAPTPVEPAGPPLPEPVDVGMECVKVLATCDGGLCAAKTKNECPAPVTCELTVVTTCQKEMDIIQATGRSRGTVNGGAEQDISAVADCQQGKVMLTKVDSMTCR